MFITKSLKKKIKNVFKLNQHQINQIFTKCLNI